METVKGLKRTKYCGEFRNSDIGTKVTAYGWVQRQRDLGQLIFIDLRDRTGIIQLAFDDHTDRAVFDKAFSVRSEYVLAAVGSIRERISKNKDIPTGDIELVVEELRILNGSETPPFEILDDTTAKEDLRLKYRYLDLRRPVLQQNLLTRSKVAKTTRDYFAKNGFIELETPMLMKSTPEGARDFLVPSRLQHGSFYALPQSPQIYKQLCMVAGFDRYIQLARCFRDEDQRADRQPEFTQIDMEMSFVDMEDVLSMGEGYMKYLFQEVLDIELETPFPRLSYQEAMNRYGTDKPDTRYGMELCDISDIVQDCGFGVFTNAIKGGGTVRAITAKGCVKKLSRKEIDKLTEQIRGIGAKGLAWIRMTDDSVSSSFSKFLTEAEMQEILQRTQAESGDVVLIIADDNTNHVLQHLGYLRTTVAKIIDIIPENYYNFLWIVDFPFFEYDEELQQWVAMHHAFTSPKTECLDYLETDQGNVSAEAYDMVLNGQELCSGSIRITDPALQQRMFNLLGLSQEEAEEKFGFLLEAFKYGAPPHGGAGWGLDRIVAELIRAESLRDVVAFPKVASMAELMSNAPSPVVQEQLDELGLTVAKARDNK